MEKRQQLLLEERLREAASLGDNDEIVNLLNLGVEINSRNQVNGWSPLHWACKRGQVKSVGILLERDADKTIETNSGETPDQLTTKTEIHQMLGVTPESIASPTTLPITPNYLQHSIATYTTYNGGEQSSEVNPPSHPSKPIATTNNDELVLKVRVASALESDFIEVELDLANLTFQNLVDVCCRELYIKPELLVKVRKLPNTIVRKDKDVQRFHDFQELEFVLRKTTVDNHAVPFQNQSIYY